MIWRALYGLLYALVMALAVGLQGTLECDLALVLTMFAAYRWGLRAAVLSGFWAGLLVGSLCGNLGGPLAAAYVGVGWWAHLLFNRSGGHHPVALLGKTVVLACGLLGLELNLLSGLGVPPSFDLDRIGVALCEQAFCFLALVLVSEWFPSLAPEFLE